MFSNIIARNEHYLQLLPNLIIIFTSVDQVRIFIIPVNAIEATYGLNLIKLFLLVGRQRMKLSIFFLCAYMVRDDFAVPALWTSSCLKHNHFDVVRIILKNLLVIFSIPSSKLKRDLKSYLIEIDRILNVEFRIHWKGCNCRVMALQQLNQL